MSDPIKAAAQRELPKRFYKNVRVEPREGCFRILLDERPVRTPAKAELSLPHEALARAVAEEWDAQGTHIDPGSMPITRIVNSALDGVAQRRGDVEDEIAKYAANDLVCYRAEAPAALAKRQAEAWDPVVAWVSHDLGVTLNIGSGIIHVAQPSHLPMIVKTRLQALDPLALAALHVVTTLTGSALLALALAHRVLDADAVWKAAHIDEDFQIEQWGWDADARARRVLREREMRAADRILTLAVPSS